MSPVPEAGGSKEIDRIGPSYWPIIVGVEGPNVTVGVPGGCYVLDAAEQERFAQAYVAACHQAKVNAGAAGRPVKHGNHGPGCGCTPCVAEPGYRQAAG